VISLEVREKANVQHSHFSLKSTGFFLSQFAFEQILYRRLPSLLDHFILYYIERGL
jgi:hypothetical protein